MPQRNLFPANSIFIGSELANRVSSKTEPRFLFARLDYLAPVSFAAKICIPEVIPKYCFLIGRTNRQTFSVCKTLSFRKGNYNGENLLNISGRDPGDFARKILRKLFTSDELATSVLPSRYDHLYLKKPLDKDRFDLLNSKS